MSRKHIFSDIDGTILEGNYIPESTITALKTAKENGHCIYLCTGRFLAILPKQLEEIIEFDGRICSSGTYIEINKQLYLDYYYPQEFLKEMITIFEKYPIYYSLETNHVVFFSDDDEELLTLFPNAKSHHVTSENYGNPLYSSAYIFDKDKPWPLTNKICLFQPKKPDLLKEITELLPSEYVLATQEMPVGDMWYCEVSPRNISKSSAINYLISNHNIPYEDTFALGDSMNDYEMIKSAHTGIVMGNGDHRLKEVADYITDDLDDDGYYKAFKHFGLI